MPVEILEIIVRANVQEPETIPTPSPTDNGIEDTNFQRQQLIEECVEQVLEILRHKEER
jgi:hypothetical protein